LAVFSIKKKIPLKKKNLSGKKKNKMADYIYKSKHRFIFIFSFLIIAGGCGALLYFIEVLRMKQQVNIKEMELRYPLAMRNQFITDDLEKANAENKMTTNIFIAASVAEAVTLSLAIYAALVGTPVTE
jgi:hypothetical protein